MAHWYSLPLAIKLILCFFVLPTLQVLRYGDPPDYLHVNMLEEQQVAQASIVTLNRGASLVDNENDMSPGGRMKRELPRSTTSNADTIKTDINTVHESPRNITTKVSRNVDA